MEVEEVRNPDGGLADILELPYGIFESFELPRFCWSLAQLIDDDRHDDRAQCCNDCTYCADDRPEFRSHVAYLSLLSVGLVLPDHGEVE